VLLHPVISLLGIFGSVRGIAPTGECDGRGATDTLDPLLTPFIHSTFT